MIKQVHHTTSWRSTLRQTPENILSMCREIVFLWRQKLTLLCNQRMRLTLTADLCSSCPDIIFHLNNLLSLQHCHQLCKSIFAKWAGLFLINSALWKEINCKNLSTPSADFMTIWVYRAEVTRYLFSRTFSRILCVSVRCDWSESELKDSALITF